jgi:hypothetical protein
VPFFQAVVREPRIFRISSMFPVLLISLSISLAAPLSAQQSWTSVEEFRTEYLQLVDALSAGVPPTDDSSGAVGTRQRISDLRQQVNTLPYPALNQLAKFYDRQTFIKMVNGLTAGNSSFQANAGTSAASSRSLILPIQPKGLLQPPNYSAAVAGTFPLCPTTRTTAATLSAEMLALSAAKALEAGANYACSTIVVVAGEGTNAPLCLIASGLQIAATVISGTLQTNLFCNSVLDEAEEDAILADLTDINADVDNLATQLTNVNNQITSEFALLENNIAVLSEQVIAGEQQILKFTTAMLSFFPLSGSYTCRGNFQETLSLPLSSPAPMPAGLLINITSIPAVPGLQPTVTIPAGLYSATVSVPCTNVTGPITVYASALPFIPQTSVTLSF